LELNFNSDKLLNVQNQETQDYNEPLKLELENLAERRIGPSPDNPPWSTLAGFLVWIASVLFIVLVPTIAVVVYLAVRGVNLGDAAGLKEGLLGDPNAILVNIIGVLPAHLATILMAWAVVTAANKHSFREMLGWEWGGFKPVYLIGIVVVFFILAVVVSNLFPEQENDLIRILRSSRSAVLVVAFMATFTAPLVEEVVYRGIMYSAFQRTFGVPIAVFLVTILFAVVHVPQYYPSYSTILVICLLSLVLTLIRARSKNLLPCIVLHTIFNAVQSLLLIAEPYLRQNVTPPAAGFHLFLH
jgi:membrane protease YdiL (CAAX protease family)